MFGGGELPGLRESTMSLTSWRGAPYRSDHPPISNDNKSDSQKLLFFLNNLFVSDNKSAAARDLGNSIKYVPLLDHMTSKIQRHFNASGGNLI